MRTGCKPVVEDDNDLPENLVDSSGNGDASSGGSGGEWKGLILSGSAIKRGAATQRIQCLLRCYRVSTAMWPPVYRCQPSKEGMTSEFERRVWSRQRPYDYAVQSDLQNQQIIQLTIGIGGSSAA